MAWVYTKYNKDAALKAFQEAARTGQRGLWRDTNALLLWEFRKQKRDD